MSTVKTYVYAGDTGIRRTLTVLNICSQSVVATAFSALVILGIVGKPDSYAAFALLMFVPVLVSYYVRKYTKSFFVFIIVHAALIVGAVMLGQTDAEGTAYFVSVLAVCAHSMAIRIAKTKRMEYGTPAAADAPDRQEREEALQEMLKTDEKMSVFYCMVMIAGSILGAATGNSSLVTMEVVLFIIFVFLVLAVNQFRALNNIFKVNKGKSEFPARRIVRITVIMMFIVMGLMLVGMLLFYNGRYGNIFSLIGTAFTAFAKLMLKAFLFILADNSEDEVAQQQETAGEESTNTFSEVGLPGYEDNNFMSSLFVAFAVVIIVALTAAVIYLIIKYVRNFKNINDDNGDIVEFIGDDSTKEKKTRGGKRRRSQGETTVNMQYRKAFKKAALAKYGRKKSGAGELGSMQPVDIAKRKITSDEEIARTITDSYEKARYSKESVSKEELDYMLDFMKKGDYNRN